MAWWVSDHMNWRIKSDKFRLQRDRENSDFLLTLNCHLNFWWPHMVALVNLYYWEGKGKERELGREQLVFCFREFTFLSSTFWVSSEHSKVPLKFELSLNLACKIMFAFVFHLVTSQGKDERKEIHVQAVQSFLAFEL